MPFELSYIEIIGVVFGFLCVWLTAIENIWCWPTGIVSVLAYIYFYYEQTLYLNVILHFIFLVASIMGWHQWLYGGQNKTTLAISHTKRKHIWKLIVFTFVTFIVFGILFDYITDDKLPYIDALLFAMSLTAQWMMNNKEVECWLVWLATDAIYTIMHFQMKNYPSFLLYASYIITATVAYYLWKRSIKNAETTQS